MENKAVCRRRGCDGVIGEDMGEEAYTSVRKTETLNFFRECAILVGIMV